MALAHPRRRHRYADAVHALGQGAGIAYRNRDKIKRLTDFIRGAYNRGMSGRKRFRPAPSGPIAYPGNSTTMSDVVADEVVGGGAVRELSCATKSGRMRKRPLRALLTKLMGEKTFCFSSLQSTVPISSGNGYMERGYYVPMQKFTVGSDATGATVMLPCFIFRLGAANGLQAEIPVTDKTVLSRPVVAYQLHCYRVSATEPWLYFWQPAAPNGYVNQMHIEREDDGTTIVDCEYRHVWSDIKLLYTAPTNVQSTLTCGIVTFNRDAWAPPDLYIYDTTSPPVTNAVAALRVNSGYYDIGQWPQMADRLEVSDAYNAWWEGCSGHPLRQNYVDPKPDKIFKYHTKWTKEFLPQQTDTSLGVKNVQHVHKHFYKCGQWYDTSMDNEDYLGNNTNIGPGNSTNIYQSRRTDATGVIPKPRSTKWFMVTAYNQYNTEALGTSFDPTRHPSFDIRLRNKVEFVKRTTQYTPA